MLVVELRFEALWLMAPKARLRRKPKVVLDAEERATATAHIYLREPENYRPGLIDNPLDSCDVIKMVMDGLRTFYDDQSRKELQLNGFDLRLTRDECHLIPAEEQEVLSAERPWNFACKTYSGYNADEYHLFVMLTTQGTFVNQLGWNIFQVILVTVDEAYSFSLVVTDFRFNYVIVWFLTFIGYFLYCINLAETQLSSSATLTDLEWRNLSWFERFCYRMQYVLFNWCKTDRLLVNTIQKVHPCGEAQGRSAFKSLDRRAFLNTYISRAHYHCDSALGYQQLFLAQFLRKTSMLLISVNLYRSHPSSLALTQLTIAVKILLLVLLLWQLYKLLQNRCIFADFIKDLCRHLNLTTTAAIENSIQRANPTNLTEALRPADASDDVELRTKQELLAKLVKLHFQQHPFHYMRSLESLNRFLSKRLWRQHWAATTRQEFPDGNQLWWLAPLSQLLGLLSLLVALLYSASVCSAGKHDTD
eukprot:Skav213095  [mRNA]  locus=scaffold512:203487:204914:- [translate_table: standard]